MSGGRIKNPITTPREAISQERIDQAKAQFEAASNPLTMGLSGIGNLAMQLGFAGGGFNELGTGGDIMKSLMSSFANMAYGGITGEKVEVEGKEVATLPTGETVEFKGPDHESGGIKGVLPEGTEVYSKRIKRKGKTMATRQKRREKKRKQLQDLIDSSSYDPILMTTQELTNSKLDKEEEQDMMLQQMVNSIREKNKMAYGGKVKKMRYGNSDRPTAFGNPFLSLLMQDDSAFLNRNEPVPELLESKDIGPVVSDKSIPSKPVSPVVSTATPAIPSATDALLKDATSKTTTPETADGFLAKLFSGDSDLTGGDAVAIGGALFNSFAPLMNTLAGRAEDSVNENFFAGFGQDALDRVDDMKAYSKQLRTEALRDAQISKNTQQRRLRNSARGVNSLRALDIASELGFNENERNIENNFAQQMLGILSNQAQLENAQDQAVMAGEQQAGIADIQDRDNFRTNLRQDLENIGFGSQQIGKMMNLIKGRRDFAEMVNELASLGYDANTIESMMKDFISNVKKYDPNFKSE